MRPLTHKQIEAYKSPERSRKISEATKGKIISDKQRKQISENSKEMWKTKDMTERNKKVSESRKGSKHPLWQGDNTSYTSLHSWVRTNYEIPRNCENCNEEKPLDAANVSGEYRREDRNDWKFLCRRCHMKSDGRLIKFLELAALNSKSQKIKEKISNTLKNKHHV